MEHHSKIITDLLGPKRHLGSAEDPVCLPILYLIPAVAIIGGVWYRWGTVESITPTPPYRPPRMGYQKRKWSVKLRHRRYTNEIFKSKPRELLRWLLDWFRDLMLPAHRFKTQLQTKQNSVQTAWARMRSENIGIGWQLANTAAGGNILEISCQGSCRAAIG
ncbi:hypothetical protein HOY80DRAFT_366039 [Tuber brumale]|nr:hypothetical protein HOY80DRAFT_366039 [Tuber brumale]